MATRRDDLFQRHGYTWQRHWTGELYVWRTTDGRLEAWQIGWGRDASGHIAAEYRATVDGELVGVAGKLRDVMDRAAVAAGTLRHAA